MKCIICNTDITLQKKYDDHAPISKPFPESIFKGNINLCTNCGHGVMETPPTQNMLQKYYQKLYWSQRSHNVKDATIDSNNYKNESRAVHQIEFIMNEVNLPSHINILEIGAAAAYSSLLIRDKFTDSKISIYACEPGEQWNEYYKQHKITKIANYFPFKTNKKFDYIHTSHWLEHVPDLNETLFKLNQLLNPNGYLFIEIPNTEHFYWDIPERDTPHIQFFTRKSAINVLKKNNFTCLKIEECGITFQDRQNGIPVTHESHASSDKGFWIRGLFQKNN